MKINELKTTASRLVGRTGLKIQKYSPEILMAAGTVAVIGGVVMACRATLHAEEVLDQHAEDMTTIADALELGDEEYTEQDAKRDKAVSYAKMGLGFAKLYAPAIALTGLGIGCYLGAHNIIQKRYLGALAAYSGLQERFMKYRDRVKEKLGEDVEKDIYNGVVGHTETEEGEPAIVLENGCTPSIYSRFFDETSTQWTRNAALNKMNLTAWQNWANDLLNARGHIFLNEVYDMLGFPRTKEGCVVGWVKQGSGDGYVDFGMYNVQREKARDFVNGVEYSILLDFNVDGPIFDKI